MGSFPFLAATMDWERVLSSRKIGSLGMALCWCDFFDAMIIHRHNSDCLIPTSTSVSATRQGIVSSSCRTSCSHVILSSQKITTVDLVKLYWYFHSQYSGQTFSHLQVMTPESLGKPKLDSVAIGNKEPSRSSQLCFRHHRRHHRSPREAIRASLLAQKSLSLSRNTKDT